MFLDEALIELKGGSGGRGAVGWRREKYIPRGGPNGGDGGRGGNVVLMADENTDTLSDFASRKKFEAPKGHYGLGQNKHGKDGEDLILRVPPGTLVWSFERTQDDKSSLLADLAHHGDQIIAARGGRGGYCNAHFISATRQAPDFAELGEPGEKREVKLELKLVADVGIIGYPNAGKSTLISVISSARPKIADYPFTTLVPNLGVVRIDDRGYVVCDIPGLIEGASEGKGLGDKFLRHIERCGVLVHLLDVSRALGEGNRVDPEKLIADYRAIRHELIAYSPTLEKKRELVVLNKIDLIASEAAVHEPELREIQKALHKVGVNMFATISAATRQGTDDLAKKLFPIVLEAREHRAGIHEEKQSDELPVLKPQLTSDRMGAYRIERGTKGEILVRGKRLEQFTVMTNFDASGARQRFFDVIERIRLIAAIKKMLKQNDAPVYIGKVRVDEHLSL